MAKLPTRKRILDLAGEGQSNPDGTSRQDELFRCTPGESVTLEREPENPYDANAVRVCSARGTCIGHLAREDAAAIAPALDEGRAHRAVVHELTGGLSGYKHHGARVSICWDNSPPIPHIDLDELQLRTRAGKNAMRGRSRDARGRLQANPKGPGCAGRLALFLLSSVAVITQSWS